MHDKANCDISVNGITANSTQCKIGNLFVATRGATKTSKDGHDFIDEAISNGAVAIIVNDDFLPKKNYPVPMVKTHDSKTALCHLAESFYDFPSKNINIIGITGTNGKTSTSFMLHSILRNVGFRPQVMGTLGMGDPGLLTPLSHTTMDPVFISATLALMVSQRKTHVIMEMSSHGLAQKRVEGLNFAACGLTNITQDHLDFHETIERYREAKARLFFERASPNTKFVLPKDHPFDTRASSLQRVIYFGDTATSDVSYSNIVEDGHKTKFTLRMSSLKKEVTLPFLGEFHVKNACFAAALASHFQIPFDCIVSGLENCLPIPGRLEPVENQHALKIFVDFAHTPDALFSLLMTTKKSIKGKLIVVFGCGGERDRLKRPIMGKIAHDVADLVIVTDDNPRRENPNVIRKEILEGMSSYDHVKEIADRRSAIKYAIETARKNDIVVIAGKGHENYQIYGDMQQFFSDHKEAKNILDSL